MVVPTGREEHGARRLAGDLEPERIPPEAERPLEIGHLQVDVADLDPSVDRWVSHY